MVTSREGAYLTLLEDPGEVRIWLEPPSPHIGEPHTATTQLAQLLAPALLDDADATALARSLLATFRSVSGVFGARPDRLAAIPGMTKAALRLIAAAHALGCRAAQEAIASRELIGSSTELERYLRLKMRCRPTETIVGLFLDRKDGLIDEILLGEGTVDHAPLYPREIVRHALLLDASAVILVHNHPTGDPVPSQSDKTMTLQIASALAALNIVLHDHFIVGNNAIKSLRQLHML